MNKTVPPLRKKIRLWKNDWIQKYLNYRIYQDSNPNKFAFRKRPHRFLWILSHMRSGSSLLTHILSANPEIIGYGETHISYQSSKDLKRLIQKVYWEGQEYRNLTDLPKLFLRESYILDKLLHDNKLLNPDLLLSGYLDVIFLVREPHRALPSIQDLKSHWSEEKALLYYCNRLKTLMKYMDKVSGKTNILCLSYDQIIDKTPLVFESLQSFLGTKTAFSENYQILKTTGAKHVGDPRGKIMAGKIVRTSRQLQQTFSQTAMDEATAVYAACCQKMSEYSLPENPLASTDQI